MVEIQDIVDAILFLESAHLSRGEMLRVDDSEPVRARR
jgi:hypothetical protein